MANPALSFASVFAMTNGFVTIIRVVYMTLYTGKKLINMTKMVRSESTDWYAANSYEIRNGTICPARKAKLKKYDPWQTHSMREKAAHIRRPPYTKLLDLSKHLVYVQQPGEKPQYVLSESSEKSALRWCRSFGLLGIVPAVTRRITTATRWEKIAGGQAWKGVTSTYRVQHGHWYEVKVNSSVTVGSTALEGDVKEPPHEITVPKLFPEAEVELWSANTNEWVTEPISGGFADFFPDTQTEARTAFPYPLPNSEAFARSYGEPVVAFSDWANRFRIAVETLSSFDPSERQRGDDIDVQRSASFLETLANTIGFKLALRPKLTTVYYSPSLLATFAKMFLLDIEAGFRACYCSTCGDSFVALDRRALYCSPTCRNTMQRRRIRERQREEGK